MDRSYEGFELFLEGRIVPFSSITIQEQENKFPQASITFPSSDDATRILAGTVVQIFGPYNGEKILLFEGEVSSINYEKSQNGRVTSVSCTHLLHRTLSATIRPKDSLVSNRRKAADGVYVGGHTISIQDESGAHSATNSGSEDVSKTEAKKNIEEVTVSSYNPFLTAFADLTSGSSETSKKILKGELNHFFDFFFNYFEQYDLFYKLVSKGFKLRPSIFGWPNPGQIKLFKTKAIYQQSSDLISRISAMQGETEVRLFNILRKALDTFSYSMCCPSSPTYVHQFWRGKNKQGPLRLQFNPGMENSPPILSNILFPVETISYSYSHPMFSEPTRMVGSFTVPGATSQFSVKGLTPMTVVPKLGIDGEALAENMTSFTLEESYRGIYPTVEQLDYFLTDTFLRPQIEQDDNGLSNPPEDAETEQFKRDANSSWNGTYPGVGEAFTQETYRRFLKSKYSQRSFTVSSHWNPSRLVGYQGMVIEESGPCIMGVISSITTSITAEGGARSDITFRAPRLIRPYEENENLINDYSQNGVMDLNKYLFDPDFYDFINIGEDLYNYNTVGLSSPGSDKLGEESSYQGFESYRDAIQNMPQSRSTDSSILSLIKDREGKFVNPKVDVDLEDRAYVYTKLLEQSVSEAINFYKKLKEDNKDYQVSEKVDNLWKRNLITKAQYFDYTGVVLNDSLTEARSDNFKSADEILSVLNNIKELKQEEFEIDSGDENNNINRIKEEIQKTQKSLEIVDFLKGEIQQAKKSKKDFTSDMLGITTYYTLYVKFGDGSITSGNVNDIQQEFELIQTSYSSSALFKIENKLIELLEGYEKQIEDLDDNSTGQENGVEKEAIKMYNIKRRNHVDKAFSQFSSQMGINVIKNK